MGSHQQAGIAASKAQLSDGGRPLAGHQGADSCQVILTVSTRGLTFGGACHGKAGQKT